MASEVSLSLPARETRTGALRFQLAAARGSPLSMGGLKDRDRLPAQLYHREFSV